jgi:hypothetical protein
MKDQFWAGLAPAITDATNALSGLLEQFNTYLKTDEGQQLLTNMGNAVSGLFEDLGKIEPEKVISGLAGVFDSIAKGFQWICDNKQAVIDALGGIVLGWGALKLTGGALDVLELINGIKGLGSGSAAAAETAGAAAGSSWGSGFASAVLKAAPWLAGIYTLVNPAGGAGDQLDSLYDENGNPTQANLDLQKHQNGEGFLTFGTPSSNASGNERLERIRKNARDWEEHQNAIINGTYNANDE